MSLRIGGAAAIMGAVLFPAGLLLAPSTNRSRSVSRRRLDPCRQRRVLVALIGLSSFQARQHPRLIWAAFALPALGTVMSCIGLVAMAAVGDRPFVAGLSPWSIWMLGVMLTVVGSALFALATFHTRALPRLAAGALATGSGILLLHHPRRRGRHRARHGRFAPALTSRGLVASSTGWIALGWPRSGSTHPRPPRDRPESVEREVVGVLVAAGPLELDLHQHVVEQRRRPEAEPVR